MQRPKGGGVLLRSSKAAAGWTTANDGEGGGGRGSVGGKADHVGHCGPLVALGYFTGNWEAQGFGINKGHNPPSSFWRLCWICAEKRL